MDDKALHLYFDGELDGQRKAKLEKRLDGELEGALEELRDVRLAVRSWYRETTLEADSGVKQEDAWNTLKASLPNVEPRSSTSQLGTWIRHGWSVLLTPKSLTAIGATCAIALAVVSTLQNGSHPEKIARLDAAVELNLGPIQGNRPEIPFLKRSKRPSPVFKVGSRPRGSFSGWPTFFKSDPSLSDTLMGFTENSSGRSFRVVGRGPLSTEQLTPELKDNLFSLQKVKALGLDIDWLHSERPFALITPSEGKEPPVIWIRVENE